MGGRGSVFVNYYNVEQSSSVDRQLLLDIMDTMDEDVDTKLEHKGYTKILKDKNIHIKQSTDKISEEIIVPNAVKVDELSNKYKSTKVLKENNEQLRIRSAILSAGTEAEFVSNSTDFKNLQLVYNQDARYYNKERLENNVQKQIDIGYWVKSDKEQLINHTVTHEYGHYIQRVLMEKDAKTPEGKETLDNLIKNLTKNKNTKKRNMLVQKYSEDNATKYIKSIQRIARKEYGRDYENQKLSDYSTKNNREYFAELFCSLNTNKTSQHDLTKAMEMFLKRRFK